MMPPGWSRSRSSARSRTTRASCASSGWARCSTAGVSRCANASSPSCARPGAAARSTSGASTSRSSPRARDSRTRRCARPVSTRSRRASSPRTSLDPAPVRRAARLGERRRRALRRARPDWLSAQIVELIVLAGFYHTVSFTTNALRIALEPSAARFPRVIRSHAMDETRRVEALLVQLTLDEKAALIAGADLWHTLPIPRLGIRALRVTDGPNGARGTACRGADLGVLPVRLGARRHLEPRARRTGRRRARRGGAHEGRARAARPDGEPPPHAARRSQLRVLRRGPAPVGADRRRVRARAPGARRRRLRQALRRQRRRVGAHDDRVRDRTSARCARCTSRRSRRPCARPARGR